MIKNLFSFDNIIRAVTLGILFFVVIMFYPATHDVFGVVKMTYLSVLCVIVCCVWISKMVIEGSIAVKRNVIAVPFILIFAFSTMSLLAAVNVRRSLEYVSELLVYFLLYNLILNNFKRENFKPVAIVVGVAGIIASIYGVLQGFGFYVFKGAATYQVYSTFGNQNYTAGFMLAVIPFCAGMFFYNTGLASRVLFAVSVALCSLCFYLSNVRGAVISLILTLAVSVVMFFLFFDRKIARRLLLSLLILSVLAGAVVLSVIAVRHKNPVNYITMKFSPKGQSAQNRYFDWLSAVTMISDKPFFGVGLNNFKENFPLYQRFIRIRTNLNFPSQETRAHNEYLQFGAEIGIIGLGSVILLFIIILMNMTRYLYGQRFSKKPEKVVVFSILAGTIGIVFYNFLNFPLHIIPTMAVLISIWSVAQLLIQEDSTEVTPAESHEDKRREPEFMSNVRTMIREDKFKIIGLVTGLCAIYVLVMLKPYVGSCHLKYGETLRARNDASIAKDVKDHYRKAIEVYDNEPLSHHYWGVMLMPPEDVKEGWEDAIKKFEDALKRNMLQEYTFVNIGNGYHELGNYREAERYYRQGIRIAPYYENFYYSLGNTYQNTEEYEKALRMYDRAIALKEDYADAYYNKGNTYYNMFLKRGDREDTLLRNAAVCYREALSIDVNHKKSHGNLGLIYQRLGDIEGAVSEYKRALDIDSAYLTVYFNWANMYDQMGRDDEAISILRTAIARTGGDGNIFLTLGNIYGEKGKADLALQYYEMAVKASPNDARVHGNLGVMYYRSKRYEDALREFENALSIDPNYAEAVANRNGLLKLLGRSPVANVSPAEKIRREAITEYEKGNYPRSLELFNSALRTDPGNTNVKYGLGLVYKKLQNLPKAIEYFSEVVKAVPNSADAMNELATCYFMSENYDRAIEQYERLRKTNQNFPSLHRNLGGAYWNKGGDKNDATLKRIAVDVWQEGLKKNPNDRDIINFLEKAKAEMQ